MRVFMIGASTVNCVSGIHWQSNYTGIIVAAG